MSDIFISYASSDRARIKPLVAALQQRGWSVWWDTTILPGGSWSDEIAKELDRAHCVLVIWSLASVHSDWVKEEAREGQRKRKLVPVLLDDVEIPLGFRGLQAANLVKWHGSLPNVEFDKVSKAISNYAPLPFYPAGSVATNRPLKAKRPKALLGIVSAVSLSALVIGLIVAWHSWRPRVEPSQWINDAGDDQTRTTSPGIYLKHAVSQCSGVGEDDYELVLPVNPDLVYMIHNGGFVYTRDLPKGQIITPDTVNVKSAVPSCE